jgi:hypothetical protein
VEVTGPENNSEVPAGFCLLTQLDTLPRYEALKYELLTTRQKCALVCGAVLMGDVGGRSVDFIKTPCPRTDCDATQSWKISREGEVNIVTEPGNCAEIIAEHEKITLRLRTRNRRARNRLLYPQLNLFD